ncbi:DUF975 family protein [Lacrimispora sp. NSJ-141]|uniref:DUF975 family protein n=1 Tax=Lientehia hominis TaxID=2897778 RepID=A0AAP2W877_9FIRM|nr:DUF975 family protein [Lientehia hominis]MCD2491860.1 DUF975 family protein [Lientehia hominis]
MWKRGELKRKSRGIIKKHYWRVIAVSFIVAFIAGSYNGTFSAVFSYDSSKEISNVVQDNTVSDFNDVQTKRFSDIILEEFSERNQTEEEIVENSPYKRGVFSSVFNHTVATGSIFSGIIAMLLKPMVKGAWLSLISAAAGAALLFFWWLLVQNIIQVGGCRFFMEADTYKNTAGKRVLYLYKIRRVWKVTRIMARKFLYQWLWSLTIIGGWIKGYSYMMVPYLAAENPNLHGREAIRVSRRMMNGNKWKAFLLDCSFIGWSLLSLMTLGLVNIFYANPYKAGVRAELYLTLRRKAMEENAEYCHVFTDRYLTAPPAEEELRAAMERAAKMSESQSWREEAKAAWEQPLDVSEEYPSVLFTVPESERRYRMNVDYHCKYGITGIILLFFIFSFVGWCWEVGLHLVQNGQFVNRGVFHGPWLPIYGSGGVLVLVLLKKFRDHPVVTFFLTVVVCGCVEYFTSWYLEITHNGVKWWDYSGYFLNLDGRICAEGLLVFGLGGCAFIYILAPLIMNSLIKKIPIKVRILLCVVLISAFAGDYFYSRSNPNTGQGITDYAWECRPEELPEKRRRSQAAELLKERIDAA